MGDSKQQQKDRWQSLTLMVHQEIAHVTAADNRLASKWQLVSLPTEAANTLQVCLMEGLTPVAYCYLRHNDVGLVTVSLRPLGGSQPAPFPVGSVGRERIRSLLTTFVKERLSGV